MQLSVALKSLFTLSSAIAISVAVPVLTKIAITQLSIGYQEKSPVRESELVLRSSFSPSSVNTTTDLVNDTPLARTCNVKFSACPIP
jgi:hypothetical protein